MDFKEVEVEAIKEQVSFFFFIIIKVGALVGNSEIRNF